MQLADNLRAEKTVSGHLGVRVDKYAIWQHGHGIPGDTVTGSAGLMGDEKRHLSYGTATSPRRVIGYSLMDSTIPVYFGIVSSICIGPHKRFSMDGT